MKHSILIIITLLWASITNAQHANGKSRSELGFLVGGTYYIGDMNPFMPYRNSHLAGGVLYRFNLNPRTAWRSNVIYGKLSGDDSESSEALNKERNLNFNTTVWEVASGIEFNYFPFQIGHNRHKGTAYILAQIALFRMNPKTISDAGSEVELQPLGTEGQGTSLNSRGTYSKIQFAVPLGVGARVSLGKSTSLNFEMGIRKTFTDYIDDLGSNAYVDPVALGAENGPLAAELSNRSLSGDRFGRRGNSSTKDWYVFTGIGLTFRLGSPSKCFPH